MLLSDSFLANSAEAFAHPGPGATCRTCACRRPAGDSGTSRPTGAIRRPWRGPGPRRARAGLEHRIGGLEKQDVTRRGHLRRATTTGGWSSCARARSPASPTTSRRRRWTATRRATCWWWAGAAPTARSPPRCEQARDEGHAVAHLHLRYLNPAAPRTSASPAPLPPDAGAREQPGPVVRCCCAAGSWWTSMPLPKVEGRPFLIREIRNAIEEKSDSMSNPTQPAATAAALAPAADCLRQLTRKDFQTDQEVRWCPGCGDYAILAQVQKVLRRPGHSPRELRLRLGHRLLLAVPLLREHLRLPRHPRPRAGHRHGREVRQPGALGLGGHRRRRRPVDRHQPPDPLPAPQPRRQDPAVQQPHLRPDQGPVLAHLRVRQEAPSPARWAPSSSPSVPCRRPWPPRPPLWPGRSTPIRTTWRRSSKRRPATAAPRSSRSCRTAGSSTTAPSTTWPTAPARPESRILLEHGKPIRFGAQRRARDWPCATWSPWSWTWTTARGRERAAGPRRPEPISPALAALLAALEPPRVSRRRSGVFRARRAADLRRFADGADPAGGPSGAARAICRRC